MKIYMGIPGTVPMVSVIEAGKTTVFDGKFGWGKTSLLGNATAKAILTDYLGDEHEANRLHSRFLWRVVKALQPDLPWKITAHRVQSVLDDIAEAEKGTAGARSLVERERPPVEFEGGRSEVDGTPLPPIEINGRPVTELDEEE